MNKKYMCILIMLSMLLIGCSNNPMTSIYNNNEKISSSTNSFNLDIEEQHIDKQQFNGVIKNIEGMDTIWTYESNEDKELDMTYMLNVTSGKLKLVLISPDNSVINLIESTNQSGGTNYSTNSLQIKNGLNRIKIVAGENTKGEFDITILEGEFKELGM